MANHGFEKLRVYQLAETLSDEIWTIVLGWDSSAKDTVGKQVVRAADSIGANIAEGAGRYSYQDNRRFVSIARGSLHSTLPASSLQAWSSDTSPILAHQHGDQ